MKRRAIILTILLSMFLASAWAQRWNMEPEIGYVYPGGGRQGDTVLVTLGGQGFMRPEETIISGGDGLDITIVEYFRPIRNIQIEDRMVLRQEIMEVLKAKTGDLEGGEKALRREYPWIGRLGRAPKEDEELTGKMPKDPLLYGLEDKSAEEIRHALSMLFFPRNKLQMNSQLAESVLLRVKVDPKAQPGQREIRIKTRNGISNPMVFMVGQTPEIYEAEPNEPTSWGRKIEDDNPLSLPVVLNGQIMPGDVDRFQFKARAGQRLVFETQARRLVPFLADAVPGWFQPVLTLYDEEGNELNFADDFYFDPDPVMYYEVPQDGIYELEIRDAIYRGRQDFVYRVTIGEMPYITAAYPLGGQEGSNAMTLVSGWNLNKNRLPLDLRPGHKSVRKVAAWQGNVITNAVTYEVGQTVEMEETEPNNTPNAAQVVGMPKVINGLIEKPGDVDVFRIEGKKGIKLVAEVHARRLRSPLDSVVRVLDSQGRLVALNDDFMEKDGHLHTDMGILTHHADSYLIAELPADGPYYIELTDTARHGSAAHAYRLRLSPPQPDFELRATPSGINLPPRGSAMITVFAKRKEGFNGPIDIELQGAPEGYTLSGNRIPAGAEKAVMTINAPTRWNRKKDKAIIPMELLGTADLNGKSVTKAVTPCDDTMQAFLWRHLVPTEEFIIALGGRVGFWGQVQTPEKIELDPQAKNKITLGMQRPKNMTKMEVIIKEGPPGLLVEDVSSTEQELLFTLIADKESFSADKLQNVIFEIYGERAAVKREGKPDIPPSRTSLGILPAIPCELAKP
ncbi:MAG: hypothetical protein ACLFUS_16505 [Candidatus Sumerlaeia bacterium]